MGKIDDMIRDMEDILSALGNRKYADALFFADGVVFSDGTSERYTHTTDDRTDAYGYYTWAMKKNRRRMNGEWWRLIHTDPVTSVEVYEKE